MRALPLVVLLSLCSACAPVRGAVASLPAAAAPYRLGPGDEVRVTVFGLDAANANYVVGDAGSIALPLIAPVRASGLTVEELAAALAEAIRARALVKAPSVSVQVQKYRPFYILGEVQKPGQYPYVPGMSVLAAVSIAGGYTFRANKKAAVIVRGGDGNVIKSRGPAQTPVQPGDTITVPEAWF